MCRIISLSNAQEAKARALADRCSLPFVDGTSFAGAKARQIQSFIRSQLEGDCTHPSFVFLFNDEGLLLARVEEEQMLSIRADFCGATVNYRRHKGGGKGQMIAKAVGLGTGDATTVLDATAGLGSDAFVLASLGCEMTLIERVPEVRVLLEDGLRSATEWGTLNDISLVEILSRMRLIEADAHKYLSKLSTAEIRPEVVYLDPMFPARNKSALVKKEMRVFHELIGADPDADKLLELALTCATKRVVVKRPRIAPTLADSKPSFTLEGKSNRFDIYICH